MSEEIKKDMPEEEIQESADAQEVVEEADSEAEQETAETSADAAGMEDEVTDSKADKKAARKKFKADKKQDALKERIDELEDRVKRQMAEFENFRKRTEREKTAMFETGAKSVIEKILPVVDNFERGLAAVPEAEKGGAFAEGMEMI